ncbi:MAG: nucleotidyltransferase family protein [Terriglobales bacterium]
MSQPPPLAALGVSTQKRAFSKEFELLCACAGVELAAQRVSRIADCLECGLDWKEVLRLAEHHGVLPLVTRNLSAPGHGRRPEIDPALQAAFEANVRRTLWFASELVRIADEFEKKQLRAIPYKGPVLAEVAYGDVALRNFGDLDFLISSADFERAKQALGELGYRPSAELNPAVERFWLRKGYERSFDSAAGKYLVELQWGVLPYFYGIDLSADELLRRSGQTVFEGREVPSLSPEDSLLVLCLHAAKHLWMRLIWVCDVAETLRTQAVDWAVVLSRARDLGVVRILGVSFWLALALFGVSLPAPAAEIVEGDPEVRILGEEFAARLARSAIYDFESPEYFRWILKLRERRNDRARYLWRLVWTPGAGDIAAVRLPEVLFPAYRLVRAVRLIRKVV